MDFSYLTDEQKDLLLWAVFNNLRFPTPQAAIPVETLYSLPVSSDRHVSLASICTTLTSELEINKKVNFFTPSKKVETLQKAIDVINAVVKLKQQELEKRESEAEKQQQIRDLQALLVRKREEAQQGLSIEQIEAKLKALQAD